MLVFALLAPQVPAQSALDAGRAGNNHWVATWTRGTRCDPEQVQVIAGAQRGLDLIARMLLDPGDAALLEEPAYTDARAALLAAGATIRAVPVDEYGLVIEGEKARDARVAYVTPSCQFPLGVHACMRWIRTAA